MRTVYKIHVAGRGFVNSSGYAIGTNFTDGVIYSDVGAVKTQLTRMRAWWSPHHKFEAVAFEIADLPSRVLDL